MKIKFLSVLGTACSLVSNPVHCADFQVGSNTELTISGLLTLGLKQSQVTNTARPVKIESRLDDNTSRIVISGKGQLKGDLQAIFRLESRFTTDTRPGTPLVNGGISTIANNSGWADGDSWIGVKTPIGQFVAGKSTLYFTDTLAIPALDVRGAGESYRAWDANAFATFTLLSQVGNNLGPIATLGMTRSQNVLRYDHTLNPKYDVSAAYSTNPAGNETDINSCTTNTPCAEKNYTNGGAGYGRVRFNDGPFTASASGLYYKIKGGLYNKTSYLGPLDTKAVRLGAAYTMDFGLKLGMVYDNTAISNGIAIGSPDAGSKAQRAVFSLPVSYVNGANAFYFTFTRAGNTSKLENSGAKQFNLAYDYAFTKQAYAGVMYTKLINDSKGTYAPFLSSTALGATGPKIGESWRQISMNVNYWF